MEAGVFFLFVVAVIALAVVAIVLYSVAAWLRHKKLHPEADKAEGPESPAPSDGRHDGRPRHTRVGNEQRTRFAARR